jgi:hypothetical protein
VYSVCCGGGGILWSCGLVEWWWGKKTRFRWTRCTQHRCKGTAER